MKFTKLSLITVALIATTSSYAMEYKTLGVQATSMGGASVASSSDSMSVFNNPAMLAKPTHDVEISLNAGVGLTDNKLGASISELDKSNFTTTLQNYDPATATAEQLATLVAGKNIILGMDGNSINVSPEAALGFQVKHIGFGVFGYSDINAKAVIDQAHNQLIIEDPNNKGNYINIETNTNSNLVEYQNTSMEYAINNNLTYLNVKGLAVSEVPVGYGQTFNTGYGSLSVGSSLKYMYGITYSENIFVDNKNITENLSTHKVTSSTFGIDTGLLYEPSFLSKSRIGLVAKNLNSPKFNTWTGEKVQIKPQVRAGVAYDIFDSLEFAADIDLTSNETMNPELKSRMIGGGLNWHPASWASLRGGLKENIDSTSSNALVYTAGVSFGLKWFQLDLAGQYSSKSNTIQGTSVPEEAKVNLALVSKW